MYQIRNSLGVDSIGYMKKRLKFMSQIKDFFNLFKIFTLFLIGVDTCVP